MHNYASDSLTHDFMKRCLYKIPPPGKLVEQGNH